MRTRYITESNRQEIQRKYIDQILGELDFMEIKNSLRNYLDKEKDRESNRSLEAEIRKEAPEVLVENWEDFDRPSTLTRKNKGNNSNIIFNEEENEQYHV
jgi:hypothetical protein